MVGIIIALFYIRFKYKFPEPLTYLYRNDAGSRDHEETMGSRGYLYPDGTPVDTWRRYGVSIFNQLTFDGDWNEGIIRTNFNS